MRLQTLFYVNCHIKEPLDSPKQLMPFEWDINEIKETYIPTDEDWQYFDEMAKKWQVKQ
jgi:hypothetical protein